MAGSLENHRRLVSWIVQNGGYLHPDVEVTHSAQKGFHVLVSAGKSVDAMTRIASCPMPATLSVLNALDVAPFRCRGTRLPPSFLQKDTGIVQTFFLMEQHVLGDTSWWSPYVATLPTPEQVDRLELNLPEDLAWLEGTNLKAALATQTEKWRALYAEGLEELKRLNWPSAIQGHYTWELFQWAATAFGSRSFTSRVLADTLPADQARPIGKHDGNGVHQHLTKLFCDGFPVLLPLLDLLNYKPRARVEWQARYSFVGLQVLDNFYGGQELCNNYGPRDNENLMLGYGFTMDENPFDHYSVAVKVPPGSPLAASRTWIADPRSDESHRCYVFNTQHPRAVAASCLEFALFSYDLLDSLSVLSGNDREMQTMYNHERTLMSEGLKTGRFEDYRNILSTISQLLQECLVRVSVLTKTSPERPPESQKQIYAQRYRDSQLSILQTAVLVCRFVLVRARCSQPDDQIVHKIIKSGVSESSVSNLKILLKRHECRSRSGELLAVNGLVELMKQFDGVQAIVEHFGNRMSKEPGAENLAKSLAAVLLGVLQVEFLRGNVLPQRFRLWIDQLTHWYPPEDPNWSYVPHDGPYGPGENPPRMLMTLLKECKCIHDGNTDNAGHNTGPRSANPGSSASSVLPSLSNGSLTGPRRWLRPEVVCWGWNVMEEEGIRVPLEIVDKEGSEESSYMLYCPRV